MAKPAPNSLAELRAFLETLPSGSVAEKAKTETLLAAAWDEISGTDAQSTHSGKLLGRTENLAWAPPTLSFVIERHGGTVCGSSRGSLHRWEIDVHKGTASCTPNHGFRQLRPVDERLDVEALAAAIAHKIMQGENDRHLKWSDDRNTASVLIGTLITAENKQTLAGRRKRFRAALEKQISLKGWLPALGRRPGTYQRSCQSPEVGGTGF